MYRNDQEKKSRFVVREEPYTYEEYVALPEEECERYELAGGMLELMSSPSPKHQAVILQMFLCITQTCGKEYIMLQDVDVIINNYEVRRPDFMLIHRSRKEIITKRGIAGPPDLVAEILSPSSARTDKVSKMKSYAEFEIPEYWVVDPLNALLEQYILIEQQYKLVEVYIGDQSVQSDKLSCISFTINELLSEAADLPNE